MSADQGKLSFVRKTWRAAPPPLRQQVNRLVTSVAQRYGQIRGSLERGGQPAAPVCVMGLFQSVLGLGAGARLFYNALDHMGTDVSTWDVSGPSGQ